MSQVFFVLTLIALGATVVSLLGGLLAMSRGGEFNARYGNRFMRWRVMLQGLTVVLFVLTMATAGSPAP